MRNKRCLSRQDFLGCKIWKEQLIEKEQKK